MKLNLDHIPLAPRRYPFFYGWMIVPLAAVSFLMSTPGQTYGVSPFTDSLMTALGLSRVDLSLAYMFGTIASALCLTPAGRLYDRFGARVMIPAASALLGLVLVLLAHCDYLAQGLARWLGLDSSTRVGFAMVLVLFFGLRFSGQGVLTMSSQNMMMKWFDRHRGLVTAVAGMVIAPAFSAAPAVLNAMVEQQGWRGAWLWLAALVGGLFTVVAVLLIRDNPEACGLKPDGPLADRDLGSRRPPQAERRPFTLAEAQRTYSFWIFALSLALFGMYITAISFHATSVFMTAGMGRSEGYLIFLYAAIVSVVLRPAVGWLSDRIPLKFLLMPMLVGLLISTVGLLLLGIPAGRWIMVGGNGLSGATIGTMASMTWPHFYGREHLGAISGFNMSITVFASAIGPWIFSACKAATGTYALSALAVGLLAVALAILAMRADNPQGGQPPATPA